MSIKIKGLYLFIKYSCLLFCPILHQSSVSNSSCKLSVIPTVYSIWKLPSKISEFLSAVMDLVYLIFTVIRNGICRGILDTVPTWMAIIYPHFIYPMYYISLFCTVQMVVAISIERLFAISAPIGHSPRCRIYILTAVLFSGN